MHQTNRYKTYKQKMFKKLTTTLLLINLSIAAIPQNQKFASPIDIPILLTGSYGELRNSHFHGGMDIRTNGQTGLPVHSIADGYISKVTVNPAGYGNAIYVTHNNGYTSLYGHLQEFSCPIKEWVEAQQYQQEKFHVELQPPVGMFAVKQGEIIALSGNTGFSGGPHLHFEIRTNDSKYSVNPAVLGFKPTDTQAPIINYVHFYPLSDSSHIFGSTKSSIRKAIKKQSCYIPASGSTINAFGQIGFGVDVVDHLDGTLSRCGIRSLELWVDSSIVHSFVIDSLYIDAATSYYSHIDYFYKMVNGHIVHRTFTEPNNRLDIYKSVNHGIIDVKQGQTYKVKIVVADAANNKSTFAFTIKGTSPIAHEAIAANAYTFKYDKPNQLVTDQIEISLPDSALFTDINDFKYSVSDSVPSHCYSHIHKIHLPTTPLCKPFGIAIKPINLPDSLIDKALIVKIDKNGYKSSVGGEYINGKIATTARFFGNYCVGVDATAPSIRALSIKGRTNLIEGDRLRFRISDNLSGIATYNGYIDGIWILFKYDAKSSTLTYYFDKKLEYNKTHTIRMEITDVKGNKATYNGKFWK